MTNRILFVPGKNPKPPMEEHRRQLLRCLRRGVERADPAVAQAIEADSQAFRLIAWNPLYYQSYRPLDEDLPWIDALLKQDGPTHADVKEALKGSDSAAIKSASEKLNEAWQAVSAELYKAASEKARAGKGPEQGARPGPEAGGPQPEGEKKDEGPIIDAEVVDEKK